MRVRSRPCSACPYRRNVPSGVWAWEEYEKLRPYDAPTFAQPPNGFSCHATPDVYCAGWAVVHSTRGHESELLAFRLAPPEGGLPEGGPPLFGSGNEAADHGQHEIDNPSPRAAATVDKLLTAHPRLREDPR